MLLIQFVCLQLLDILTTLVFLNAGISEGNPLVRTVLRFSGANAALTLLALKSLAVGFAWNAWRTGRRKLLARINILFALCIVWNGIAIATALS